MKARQAGNCRGRLVKRAARNAVSALTLMVRVTLVCALTMGLSLSTTIFAMADDSIATDPIARESSSIENTNPDNSPIEKPLAENPLPEEVFLDNSDSVEEAGATVGEDFGAVAGTDAPEPSLLAEPDSVPGKGEHAASIGILAEPLDEGEVFKSPITVGDNNEVPCTFKVTKTGVEPEVSVGSGSAAAIDISTAGDLVLPETVKHENITYKVVEIAKNAFQDCTGLTSTGLGENTSITTLSWGCFDGCTGLTSTGLAKNTSVTTLGYYAFRNCSGLVSTGLGTNATITSMVGACFAGCTRLTCSGLATNETLKELPYNCFESCTSLTSTGLEENSSITTLGQQCFIYCDGLISTGLETNATVTTLGTHCFYRCRDLVSTGLETNSKITEVSTACFMYCTGLESTGLATNTAITILGESSFNGCTSLINTGLESNVTIIILGNGSFNGCTSLINTGLESNTTVTTLGENCFALCSSLESTGLETNTTITVISLGCFADCVALTKTGLETPNSVVREIEEFCFFGCLGLTAEIVLGKETVSVGENAFNETLLQSIYLFSGNEPAVGNNAFKSYATNNPVLYVPDTSWAAELGEVTLGGTTFKRETDTLITMSAPALSDMGVTGRTADAATITLTSDVAGKVTITGEGVDETHTIQAGANTLSLTGISGGALSVSLGTSAVYPATATPTWYNTYQGEPSAYTVAIPQYTPTPIHEGETFIASITVGDVTTIACAYTVVDEGTSPKVKIGNGTESAIDQNTPGALVLPETITYEGITYEVIALAEGAFKECVGLTSTGFGENTVITSVPTSCFERCTGLTSTGLDTNTTITTLGARCFAFCSELTSTGFEQNPNLAVERIMNEAFGACYRLTGDLVLGPNIQYIEGNTYRGCNYENIYLLTDEEPTILENALGITGSEAPTLYVPITSWAATSDDVMLGYEAFSRSEGTLVTMTTPALTDILVTDRKDNSASVNFVASLAGQLLITNSEGTPIVPLVAEGRAGTLLAENKEGMFAAGTTQQGWEIKKGANTIVLMGITPDALSLTLSASAVYPATATPTWYNTYQGTASGYVLTIPAVEQSPIVDGPDVITDPVHRGTVQTGQGAGTAPLKGLASTGEGTLPAVATTGAAIALALTLIVAAFLLGHRKRQLR